MAKRKCCLPDLTRIAEERHERPQFGMSAHELRQIRAVLQRWRSVSPSSGWRFEKADQLADGVVAVLGMAKWELVVDFVLIAASLAGLRQVAGALEILDQLSGRSFRDAYGLRNVSEACTGIGRDAYEHVRVVGDKGPTTVSITGNAFHES
jgi:hypothetical protein